MSRRIHVRPWELLSVVLLMYAVSSPLAGQTLAFPGADGFGKYTTGGRGGVVLHVTTLEDDGPGSFRAAIGTAGPRTIIFRVSGTIVLRSPVTITNGDLTIAGQTAPGDGICVRDYPIIVAADNVIVRFLRFRLGDAAGQAEDAMMGLGRRDIIIDHCSFSWGIDEVATFYNNENFTLQWCIISESLDKSVHAKGEHGYGGIWGGYRASFHHNLLAHHTSRNPRFQGGRWAGWAEKEEADFRNNVVFNWGFECMYGGESGRYNIVGNYFKPGPASVQPSVFLSVSDTESSWYIDGNFLEGHPGVTANNHAGVRGKGIDVTFSSSPFLSDLAGEERAADAFISVLAQAGATLPSRDAVDARIIEEVRTGRPTYGDLSYRKKHRVRSEAGPVGIINSQSTVGGWPNLRSEAPAEDSDGDGIPDTWESAHGLDPNDPTDGAAQTGSGYTYLEIYINELTNIE